MYCNAPSSMYGSRLWTTVYNQNAISRKYKSNGGNKNHRSKIATPRDASYIFFVLERRGVSLARNGGDRSPISRLGVDTQGTVWA